MKKTRLTIFKYGFLYLCLLATACTSNPTNQNLSIPDMPIPSVEKIRKFSEAGTNSILGLPDKSQVSDFNSCMVQQKEVEEQAEKLLKKINNFASKLKAKSLSDIPYFGLIDLNQHALAGINLIPLLNEADPIPDLKGLSGETDFLLPEYLKAYFGSVKGILVKLETKHPATWDKAISNALKLDVNSPTVKELLDSLTTQLANNPNLAMSEYIHIPIPKEEPGFISRDGTRYKFPGLSWKGTSVTVDQSQVGADFIRIILEAFRDRLAPLPFVANATRVKLSSETIEIYNPESAGWNVSPDDFLKIQAAANQIEGVVGGAVGKVLRGASTGALNNEAIAKVVETAAGVIARHTAERVGWCARKAKVKLPTFGKHSQSLTDKNQ